MELASKLPEPKSDRLKASPLIFSTLSIYFIAVGVLYLWGYWGYFHVNIMEYMGLSDVVKVAAWPVGSAFVFMLVGMVLGEMRPADVLPAGGGRSTSLGGWLNKHRTALAVSFMLGLVALLAFGPTHVWPIAALLAGIVLALPLQQLPHLVKLIPHASARTILTIAAVVLPLFAFAQGRVNADKIYAGQSYFYVLSDSDGVSATGSPQSSMRYVGFAGGTFFFWDPDVSGVTLIPSSVVKSLKLARMPKPK